jgi:hypothetical protein
MQKYGIEHFRMELVEICPDKDAMLERELYWISFYNTVSPYGYNSTHGGEHNGGRTFSEEHKRKLSEAGKKISEEGRAKISERSRAMWANPDLREKMIRAFKKKVVSESTKEKLRAAGLGKKNKAQKPLNAAYKRCAEDHKPHYLASICLRRNKKEFLRMKIG